MSKRKFLILDLYNFLVNGHMLIFFSVSSSFRKGLTVHRYLITIKSKLFTPISQMPSLRNRRDRSCEESFGRGAAKKCGEWGGDALHSKLLQAQKKFRHLRGLSLRGAFLREFIQI